MMLPTEDVRAIKRYILERYRDTEIAAQFKCSRLTVRRIRLSQTHADTPPARSVGVLHKHVPAPRPRPIKLTLQSDEAVAKLKEALAPAFGVKPPRRDGAGRGAQAGPRAARPGPERPNAPTAPTSTPVTALDAPTAASVAAEVTAPTELEVA